MNFKQYFEEANIQRLTSQEEQQVSNITDHVWFKIKPLKSEEIEKLKNDPDTLDYENNPMTLVGKISYVRRDLKTAKAKNKVLEVYINWGENKAAMASFVPHHNPSLDYIELNYKILNDVDSKFRLKALLNHEVIHAVQHYRKSSEKYQEVSQKPADEMQFYDWVDYYSEPMEKEAVFSEMDSYIRSQYNALLPSSKNNKGLNEYLNRNRETYLLELKLFVTTPLENYIINKELPLPSALQQFDWFLTVLLRRTQRLSKIEIYPEVEKKLTALKKELKRKLLFVYNDLQNKESKLDNT